jgi:hypothetical protein
LKEQLDWWSDLGARMGLETPVYFNCRVQVLNTFERQALTSRPAVRGKRQI